MIERKILIALITQTEYLRQIQSFWKNEYLESTTAQTIAVWVWEYFTKYHKAPNNDMESIYFRKIRRNKINKDVAEEIETILQDLSNEFESDGVNISYLIDQTKTYFSERKVTIHNERVAFLIEKGEHENAEKEILQFKSTESITQETDIDLSDPIVLNKIESAFDVTYQNVLSFPGALGDFWNDELVRGGLVGILAPEKRGKTFLLLEFMMRAYRQKKKVAFFQIGDMTENQQLIRICIYLAQKSNKEKYCGTRFIPVQDCVKNQADTCDKHIRECSFGVFNMTEEEIRKKVDMEMLKESLEENPTYKNCYNCKEWLTNKWGAVWLKKIHIDSPLTSKEAKKQIERFFIKTKRSIKLSTHVNGTFTITTMRNVLRKWKDEGFVPDICLLDYGDLVVPETTKMEFRHQQNQIWKDLRGISQEEDMLLVVPTQADANSYSQDTLDLKNYSEDKRKYAHVTAMYGLNQDVSGREKQLGIMRINKMVVREGDFHLTHQVHVLQRLEIGRPFLGSYY